MITEEAKTSMIMLKELQRSTTKAGRSADRAIISNAIQKKVIVEKKAIISPVSSLPLQRTHYTCEGT